MKKVLKATALAAALLLLLPALARADNSASKHFPNDQPGNVNVPDANPIGDEGDMSLQALVRNCKPVQADHTLVGGETGEQVAAAGINALCNACSPNYEFIEGYINLTPCSGLACCTASAGDNVRIECKTSMNCRGGGPGSGLKGYRFIMTGGDFFKLEPAVDTGDSVSLNSQTKAGNTIGTDLLPNFVLRVDRPDPNIQGEVVVRLYDKGSNDPNGVGGAIKVNTEDPNGNAKTDEAIHEEIAQGLESRGVVPVVRRKGLDVEKYTDSAFPGRISGPYLFLPGFGTSNSSHKELSIKVLKSQSALAETVKSPRGGGIPTLNEWGLIILIAVLLLSAAWMLQRRRARGHGTA